MGSANSNKQAVMSFIKELKRRNVFRVAIAYAIVAWLTIEVSATTFPMLRLPEWTATFVTVLLIIGFPLALLFAWAFELTPAPCDGIENEAAGDGNALRETPLRRGFSMSAFGRKRPVILMFF